MSLSCQLEIPLWNTETLSAGGEIVGTATMGLLLDTRNEKCDVLPRNPRVLVHVVVRMTDFRFAMLCHVCVLSIFEIGNLCPGSSDLNESFSF